MTEERLWTAQEIRLLKQLVEVDKLKWKQVALELDRSYHGAYHKYFKIKRQEKAKTSWLSEY